MALTLVSGVRARDSAVSTREDTDYAKGIALLDRWVNPLTLMTLSLAHYQADTVDFHHFEDEYVPYTDAINNGAGYSNSDTSIVVDDGTKFIVGDLIEIVRTTEVVLVTAISTNTLTVIRDYGQAEGWTTRAAAMVDDDPIRRLSNAYEQGHPLPGIVTTQEVDIKNYCQDIRTAVGLSEVHAAAKHRGEADEAFQERKAAVIHMEKLEMANWFGLPYAGDKGLYSGTHGSGDKPTTCGGVDHFIVNNNDSDLMVDQDDLTMFEYMDFLEAGFDKGSKEKFQYVPPAFRTGLDKWGIVKMQTFVGAKVLGMEVSKWVSAHGTVYFLTHDMLKRQGATLYYNTYLVDQEKLSWVTYSDIGSTRLRRLNPYEATGATKKEAEYQSIQGVRTELPECHARLRFKTTSVS